MPVYSLNDTHFEFPETGRYWIAPTAVLIGSVTLGLDVGIWFGAVLRGDNERLIIGAGSNIQDNAVLHSDMGFPLQVGEECTVGHQVTLHGCTIGRNSLVGIGATVMNGATIGENSLVGARALITEGKAFPAGSLIVGAPARVQRQLTPEEIERNRWSAGHYVKNWRRYAENLSE